MATPRKTPAEKAATRTRPKALKPTELVTPKHGAGKLRKGNPGNRGGVGQTPSELREKMRGSLSTRIKIAEKIADDTKATASDRLRALEFLAKHGLGGLSLEDGEGPQLLQIVLRDEGPAARRTEDAEG